MRSIELETFDMLTQEQLKEIISYDAVTGIFTNLVNRRKAKAGTVAGGIDGMGYWQLSIKDKPYRGHRLAWLYVHGAWPTDTIDHINGNRSDNRLVNLRAALKAENNRNTNGRGSSCGFKGVTLNKKTGKYIAQIHAHGMHHHLGCFDRPEDAAYAYTQAATRLHGKFARLAYMAS